MRRAKVDKNQGDIVRALRQIGCSVQSLASVGRGCPDLMVGFQWRNVLLEVKDVAKDRHKDVVARQGTWRSEWNGPVFTVRTAEEAIAALTPRGQEAQGKPDGQAR